LKKDESKSEDLIDLLDSLGWFDGYIFWRKGWLDIIIFLFVHSDKFAYSLSVYVTYDTNLFDYFDIN
jgi:hypothetical protein